MPRARSFSPTELYQLDETASALSLPIPIPIPLNPTNFLESEYSQSAQRSASRKLALRYYIQTFTPMLTTNLENNGFLSGIPYPPWALNCLDLMTYCSPLTYGYGR